MFDDDQLTESAEVRVLRDSLAGVALPPRPPLEAIRARGRARRRRRLSEAAGVLVTVVAAGTTLTLGFVGALGRDGVQSTTRTSTPHTIRTPSYTLVSDTSGRVKLTFNPKQLFHPAALQSDLARFGIPAKVTSGSVCTSNPAPAGLARVVSIGTGRRQTITIDPPAIAARTELSVGTFQLRFGQVADVALIDTESHTCTRTVPTNFAAGTQLGYIRLPSHRATSRG